MTERTIERGDAFTLLEGMPDNYAHAAVVDYPWEFSNGRRGGRQSYDHDDDWQLGDDTRVPELLETLRETVVDGGWVFMFADDGVLPDFRKAVEDTLEYRKTLIWDTEWFGMGHYYRSRHQYIVAATVGETDRYVQSTPTVFSHRCSSRGAGRSADYPTEKPVSLYREFLEEPTNDGERVIEPFCGTAPGLGAAKSLNLSYWGCDVSPDALEHAQEHQRQQSLF